MRYQSFQSRILLGVIPFCILAECSLTSARLAAEEVTPLAVLEVNDKNVKSLAFSPDAKMLAASGYFGVMVWNLSDRKLHANLETNEENPFEIVTFGPDSRTLVVGNITSLFLWDMINGKRSAAMPVRLGCFPLRTALSRDGNALAATTGCEVEIFDVATGKPKVHFYSAASEIAFTPDSKTLAVMEFDGCLRFRDAASGKPKSLPNVKGVESKLANSSAFSVDCKIVATAGNHDNCVKVWDIASGKCIATLTQEKGLRVRSIAFSPDARTLAVVHLEGTISIWNIESARETAILKDGPKHKYESLTFSPDGKILATGSTDTLIKLWGVSKLTK